MSVIRIILIGIMVVLLSLQLKQTKPEFAVYLSLASGVLILGFAAGQLGMIVSSIQRITELISIDQKYITILLKVIGVTYLCEFASNICRDSGYTSVSSYIEMAGKLGIMVMSLPIVMSLVDTIQKFLK